MSYTKLLCGQLYDGLKDCLQPGQEILIEGNKILEVGPHTASPQGCKVIDLSALTVTPGNGLFSVSVTTPLISTIGDFSSRRTEITTVFPVTLYVRFVPFNAASNTSPTVASRKSKVIPFTPATACALKNVW